MNGMLAASMTQTCVARARGEHARGPGRDRILAVAFDEERAETVDEAASHGTLDWPEPIVDNRIDFGPVLYETLGTALESPTQNGTG